MHCQRLEVVKTGQWHEYDALEQNNIRLLNEGYKKYKDENECDTELGYFSPSQLMDHLINHCDAFQMLYK